MAEKVPLADVRVSFGPPELRILPQVNRPLTPFLSALVGSIVHSPAFETNVDPPTANLSCSPSAVGEEPTKAGPFSDMTEPQKMAIEPGAGANLDLAVGGTARSMTLAFPLVGVAVILTWPLLKATALGEGDGDRLGWGLPPPPPLQEAASTNAPITTIPIGVRMDPLVRLDVF